MQMPDQVGLAFPNETKLIALLSSPRLRPEVLDRIRALLKQSLDWERVLDTAVAWEVEAVALSNLRTQFSDAVPAEILAEASDRERTVRALSLARGLATLDLVQDLSNAGIQAIVLKGAALAITAYEDVSMRSYGDIDLLLHRADLPRARALLVSRGYTPDYDPSSEDDLIHAQHALELSTAHYKVELHWSLLSKSLRLDLFDSEIWREAVTLEFAGGALRSLPRPHLFLFLCAHGTKHKWMNPRWICDVASLIDRMSESDVADVVSLAERSHSRRLLAIGVRVAHDILGINIGRFEANLEREHTARPLVEGVRRRLAMAGRPGNHRVGLSDRIHPGLSQALYWASARERFIDRLSSVSRMILVPTHDDKAPGPIKWLARPIRLATQLGVRLRSGQ